jgi:GT2 family glycosyltransferase
LFNIKDFYNEYSSHYFINFLLQKVNLPFFSIIIVVADPPADILIETLNSIKFQIYPKWELIIFNNNSKSDDILNLLNYIKTDSVFSQKITIENSSETFTIPEAFNKAVKLSQKDYLVFIDHDDCISPETLSELAINLYDKNYKFCYTDSYTIDTYGKAFIHHKKPDWSPETLLSFNYINHLTVFRKDFWDSLSGYSERFNGVQDWEILLRIRELLSDKDVLHIKKPLYGWKAHRESTAYKITEKNWIKPVVEKVWNEKISGIFKNFAKKITIKNNNGPGFIFPEKSNYLPEINIIIPSKDNCIFLKNCINAILKNKYPCFNIVVIDNGSSNRETLDYLNYLKLQNNIQVISKELEFNWSVMNNMGAESVKNKNSVILFLNDDILIYDEYFLQKMVQPFIMEEIGIIGALLKFPDNTIQHNGIYTNPKWIASEIRTLGTNNILNVLRNVSAVTGACMMVKSNIFNSLYFDEDLPINYNDVDFCLQVRQKDWRVINNPNATAIHYHMTSRELKSPKNWEIEYMQKKWGNFLEERYYYNWEIISDKSVILKV